MSFLRIGLAGSGMPPFLEQLNNFLYFLTEPVMEPVRKLIPPLQMGAGGLDLSPILVLMLLRLLQGFIITNLL